MNHYVVSAILRDFSRNNNCNKWDLSGDELHKKFLPILFYANGNCKDNEGYVSIVFSNHQIYGLPSHEFYPYYEIRFHVSVVDVAGNKKFTQSVSIFPGELEPQLYAIAEDASPDDLYHFGLERYLKRETLLDDPAELLPDDCLTIRVEVERYKPFDRRELTSTDSTLEESICRNETETYIPLDTDFGRELCRVSEVFRCASDVDMIESRTRMMPIPEEERIPFITIWRIFYESEMSYITINEICDLYRVADKYDIQPVIETCRQFVKAIFLAAGNPFFHTCFVLPSFRQILKLAFDYRDDDLKETLKTYAYSKDNFGTNYHAFEKDLKEKLHTDWKCEFTSIPDLHISSMRRRVIEPEFQFYQ